MSDVKKTTTIDEQIEILKQRGLIINDYSKAFDFLSRVNYYAFTGYLFSFKIDDCNYKPNISFEKIYNIYKCDIRFKNILLYAIDIIEHSLKTKLAYTIAHELGPLGYLDENNYKDKNQYEMFIKYFNSAVENNKNILFVKHHIKKYNGQFPIWVAVELFTMGNLYHLYKNINTRIQKIIAKEFNTGTEQMISWIYNVKYLRNMAAHYMRLYELKLQSTPKYCKNNFKYRINTYKIFDIVYMMKFLFIDKNEWNNYIIPNIESLFNEFKEYIDINAYGFPENWVDILKK